MPFLYIRYLHYCYYISINLFIFLYISINLFIFLLISIYFCVYLYISIMCYAVVGGVNGSSIKLWKFTSWGSGHPTAPKVASGAPCPRWIAMSCQRWEGMVPIQTQIRAWRCWNSAKQSRKWLGSWNGLYAKTTRDQQKCSLVLNPPIKKHLGGQY